MSKRKQRLYFVEGWNEWMTAKKSTTVWAFDAKDAKEQVSQSRTMDGGIISARLAKPPRRSDPERGGPNDR
jgi:hypothetical protein